MVVEAASLTGCSSSRKTGGRTTLVHWMRMSSVVWNMAFSLAARIPIHFPASETCPGDEIECPIQSLSARRRAEPSFKRKLDWAAPCFLRRCLVPPVDEELLVASQIHLSNLDRKSV